MQILKESDLDAAAHAIDNGGIVIVPTSRWYMICCDASNQDACARIFRAKARPTDKQLLLVVASHCAAESHFHLTDEARCLIRAFWPGDLSLRLAWRDPDLGRSLGAVGPEVALVGNSSGIMGELAKRTRALIATTSANISLRDDNHNAGPAITLREVIQFAQEASLDVSIVIDGGICPQFTHTTIVDCSDSAKNAAIIREGVVHRRAIQAALAELNAV
jgi:L-threonylcarbamoyladenylate synthase